MSTDQKASAAKLEPIFALLKIVREDPSIKRRRAELAELYNTPNGQRPSDFDDAFAVFSSRSSRYQSRTFGSFTVGFFVAGAVAVTTNMLLGVPLVVGIAVGAVVIGMFARWLINREPLWVKYPSRFLTAKLWAAAVNPLEFGYLWIWAVNIATLAALLILPKLHPEPGRDALLHYVQEFASGLIVTVLVFIAEHIIIEMIATRDAMYDVARRSHKIGGELRTLFVTVEGIATKQSTVFDRVIALESSMQTVAEVKHFDETLVQLAASIAANKSSGSEFASTVGITALHAFQKGFRESLVNISRQVKPVAADPLVTGLLLQFLEAGLKDRLTLLESGDQKRLVGTWETLGDVARGIINVATEVKRTSGSLNTPDLTFYTLLAKSPASFFQEANERNAKGARKYPAWTTFIESAHAAAVAGVRVRRHFLAFEDKLAISQGLPRELRQTNVRQDLTQMMRVADGQAILDGEPSFWDETEDETMPVWKALDTLYHVPNCCGVTTCLGPEHLEDFKEPTQNHDPVRTKDYFAVKSNGEWVFCLRALVQGQYGIPEASRELTEIEAHYTLPGHPASAAWTELQATLDRLFSTEPQFQNYFKTETLEDFIQRSPAGAKK